jgi:hypothetical protein
MNACGHRTGEHGPLPALVRVQHSSAWRKRTEPQISPAWSVKTPVPKPACVVLAGWPCRPGSGACPASDDPATLVRRKDPGPCFPGSDSPPQPRSLAHLPESAFLRKFRHYASLASAARQQQPGLRDSLRVCVHQRGSKPRQEPHPPLRCSAVVVATSIRRLEPACATQPQDRWWNGLRCASGRTRCETTAPWLNPAARFQHSGHPAAAVCEL